MAPNIEELLAELDHIVEAEGPQHILRVMYHAHRAHSGMNGMPQARATFMDCLHIVKEHYRDFDPKYDQAFFE